MMRVEISRRCGVFAVLLAVSLLCAGCGGKGAGETVPSPPRDLVDKSFHPPAGAAQSGPPISKASSTAPPAAGK